VSKNRVIFVHPEKEKKMRVFTSGNVSKFVFDQEDSVYETVLYKYHDRTVVCCSVMSGCPVGCTFCGTGNRFIKNLSAKEIAGQIHATVGDKEPQGRFQIMFMSMGEPLLNWDNVSNAIQMLSICYPDAELLISTIAPITPSWKDLLMCSYIYEKIGLQFSIHQSTDERRNMLIPYTRKLPLSGIYEPAGGKS
jgi:23S rRNA (adenine2503-C2)-methyltransferase